MLNELGEAYYYGKQSQPIKVVAYEPNGQLKHSWKYSYDAKGQVTGDMRETDWSKQTFAYEYQYDSHGNWTKKIVTKYYESKLAMDMENSKAISVVSREISYYE